MQKYFLFATLGVLMACSTSKLVMPTQADADKVAAEYSGVSLSDLKEGRSLYQQHCGTCHGLKDPNSKPAEAWKKIVPGMSKAANKKAGKEVINAKQQEQITKYLVAVCEKPVKK